MVEESFGANLKQEASHIYGFYLGHEYLPANFTSSSETRLENMAVLDLYLINKVLLVAMPT